MDTQALAPSERASADMISVTNIDCIEKLFIPIHSVRLLLACAFQVNEEVEKPDIAAHNQAQAFGCIVVTKEDVSHMVQGAELSACVPFHEGEAEDSNSGNGDSRLNREGGLILLKW